MTTLLSNAYLLIITPDPSVEWLFDINKTKSPQVWQSTDSIVLEM
jgi:hypothetical protein